MSDSVFWGGFYAAGVEFQCVFCYCAMFHPLMIRFGIIISFFLGLSPGQDVSDVAKAKDQPEITNYWKLITHV